MSIVERYLPARLLFEKLVRHGDRRHCCERLEAFEFPPISFRVNLSVQTAFGCSDGIDGSSSYLMRWIDRSSLAFWKLKKKEVMAMNKKLGCAALFLTLSAAETQWSERIVILT